MLSKKNEMSSDRTLVAMLLLAADHFSAVHPASRASPRVLAVLDDDAAGRSSGVLRQYGGAALGTGTARASFLVRQSTAASFGPHLLALGASRRLLRIQPRSGGSKATRRTLETASV